MVRVKAVTPMKPYWVVLLFTDGSSREVDLEPYLHGKVFEPIRQNPIEFAAVTVDPELGTLVWPNGADIDPDVLYLQRQPAWQEAPVRR